MITFPNAKINLGLNIVEKRSDGFHNIETIFYPIQIKDSLEILANDELDICVYGADIVGDKEENLCIKAYKLLSTDFNLDPVKFHLLKNIPTGAGLGGGSSDAAFSIKMLNTYFELNIDDKKQEEYASLLGADCAFFIRNKPVFAEGKGDIFSDINIDLSKYFLVVLKPDVFVSTPNAYRNCIPVIPEKSLKEIVKLPVHQWKGLLKNDFETTVFEQYKEISELKNMLYSQGALYASMSGSGSALFAIFEKEVELDIPSGVKIYYNV